MPLLPRFRPRPEHVPRGTPPSGPSVRVRWLGTAAHCVETPEATILIDPFLTRPSLLRTAAQPLRATPERWSQWLPPRVDAVLLGHSHYDHLMDAPAIAKRTGARIAGSRTTASFARAEGVPEDRIVEVGPEGERFDVGDVTVRFVPSLHARIAAGRVPLEGEVREPPRLPARLWHYRMGGAYGIHLTLRDGTTLYHNGSADLVDAELAGLRADVAMVGLAGRRVTPGYLERLYRLLSPELVIPTHHDFFFFPLEDGVRLLPGVDMNGFADETRRLAPDARIVTPTYEDAVHVPTDARAADTVVARL